MYTISRSVLHRHHLARDPFTITPAKKGPRRLGIQNPATRIHLRGKPEPTALLIINPCGVWSVTHRRYIRRTRRRCFRDLNKDLHPVRKKVRRYRMKQWPQYRQDEELRSLRCKLANFYWAVMPEEVKARTVLINKIFLKNSCTTE
jgi:hypothetical protein